MNKTRLASLADSLSVKVMLLFLVFQVAFVLSNTAANCLPRPVIESHAQGSASSALLSDMYVYDHRVAALQHRDDAALGALALGERNEGEKAMQGDNCSRDR